MLLVAYLYGTNSIQYLSRCFKLGLPTSFRCFRFYNLWVSPTGSADGIALWHFGTETELPDNTHVIIGYNWLVKYFKERGYVTRFAEVTSAIAYIDASVIQGSVLGPPSFITCA